MTKDFTEEEMRILQKNPYVEKVNYRYITYTPEFRSQFTMRYLAGEMPTAIFRSCGFDPKMLGRKRIERYAAHVRQRDIDQVLPADSRVIPVGTQPWEIDGYEMRTEDGRRNDEQLHRSRVIVRKMSKEEEERCRSLLENFTQGTLFDTE